MANGTDCPSSVTSEEPTYKGYREGNEKEGKERETMIREVLSPIGITVRTRKRPSCHEGKINQTHLIMTEGRRVLG